ncbi:methyltransferase [Thermomonospora amylolytica]|uniref:methyltransferase n=1 Tax=Thermomonospora amylolytica TaxID=1411117 RepID=UPI000E6CEE37|nr:methyltransferase [Thermomonospora amylolytica]
MTETPTIHGDGGRDAAGPSAFEQLAAAPARHQLVMLTMGRVIAPVIWALTELRVADHLAAGPLPVGELARRTGTDEQVLLRMLRCAAAYQVFAERPGREFALTPMSELLRDDVPQSVRDLVLMNGTELFWRPYEAVLHTARTGRPAFEAVFGMPLFDYLETKPDLAGTFHRAMTAVNRGGVDAIAEAIASRPFTRVADIGGGQGYLLAALLERRPDGTGVLFDRPAALEGARALLDERGMSGRVELAPGDFFSEVPGGCDVYVLKLVLHDWADADAVRILKGVRAAMADGAGARLHVVEHTAGEPNTLDMVRLLDMDMLFCLGGRERSVEEYRALGEQVGLRLAAQRRAGRFTVMEFAAR